MEHTLLRVVRDFFVFGSRTGLSHQRFGEVVGYLKVVAEDGGEPASVHVESQEKRRPDQQSNRVRIRKVNHSNVKFELIKGPPSNAVFRVQNKKQFASQDSLQPPFLYNNNTKTSSCQEHHTEKLGGG